MKSHQQPLRSILGPRTLAVVLTAVGLLAASLAHAEDGYNPLTGHTFNNPTSSLIDTMLLGKQQERALELSFRDREQQEAVKTSPQQHQSLMATDFKPARRGHPTADALVSSAQGPIQRKQLGMAVAAAFARIDAERANNIATALAAAIGMARQMISDQDLTDDAFESLRASLNDTLASAPSYLRLPRAKKQALYEYLVFNTTVLSLAREAGKADPGAKASGVALANNLLGQFGGAQ